MLLVDMTCIECNKMVYDDAKYNICSECRQKTDDRKKLEYLNLLKSKSLEERLALIEESLYDAAMERVFK